MILLPQAYPGEMLARWDAHTWMDRGCCSAIAFAVDGGAPPPVDTLGKVHADVKAAMACAWPLDGAGAEALVPGVGSVSRDSVAGYDDVAAASGCPVGAPT